LEGISDAGTLRYRSEFTSINDLECFEVPRTMTAYYDKRQLDANECLSAKGWRLFKVLDTEESWIDIAHGNRLWSTEFIEKNQIEKNVGYRPHMRSEMVEWRLNKAGEPISLIYRVHAQQLKKHEPFTSRLFVISLKNNTPSFCGIAKTNKEAREIADKEQSCVNTLPNVGLENGNSRIIGEKKLFTRKNPTKMTRYDNSRFRNQHTSADGTQDLPELPKKLEAYLNRYDRFFSEYDAPVGWQLFAMFSQDYSWFDIVRGRSLWSTYQVIGNVGPAATIVERVQWRMTKTGAPKALIFRVRAQKEDNANIYISRLIVISLTGNTPRYCGTAKTNIEAYAIADRIKICAGDLTFETLPK
jgi:hypothetical protein